MLFVRSGIYPTKEKQGKQGKGLKLLCPNQILQRLPIALAKVKTSNTSENLLNGTDKPYIICSEQKKLLKQYATIK